MHIRSSLCLLIVASGLALGSSCSHDHAERRPHAASPHSDWVRLGERWVDGVRDRDVIAVGAREGTYRRIMIVVDHSSLEMFDVEVTFGDGSRFSPRTRLVFGPNSRSQIIDLPGDRRVIRSVEFRYGNLPGGGRAQAELWAQ